MSEPALEISRALWNRAQLHLRSDEVLAQLLDRGELAAWRALYRLAREDAALRQRLVHIVLTVPLPMPHLWLAALKGLGEPVEVSAKVPPYAETGT
jgi:hypothetical protein